MQRSNLKVLMIARADLLTYPGGDTTQVLETAKALQELGLEVDLNPAPVVYNRYDIMHFFNIIDPEDILGHVHRSGLPFVISTIYCEYAEFDQNYRTGFKGLLFKMLSKNAIEYVKTMGKVFLLGEKLSSTDFIWRGHKGSIQYILKRAGCLLPNSHNEYNRVLQDFGVAKDYVWVPNAVNLEKFTCGDHEEQRNLVICVSRIEGRKNHLNMVKALSNTDYEVYLVGRPANNQKDYYDACKSIAGKNIHFTGYVSLEELVGYYRRAKVHVLPSWFETTGLASLEASLMGCNVVVGDRGDVREYFQSDAWYCEPSDPVSIKNAVDKAFVSPYNTQLPDRIRRQYTWQEAAKATVEGYERALNM